MSDKAAAPPVDPNLEAARNFRRVEIEARGIKYIVREIDWTTSVEFQVAARKDSHVALAKLVSKIVLRPDMTPAFTEGEALELVLGPAKNFDPFAQPIFEFLEPPEKKASTPPSGSTTG